MNSIENIYKVSYQNGNGLNYAGTLMDGRVFEIDDSIFFSTSRGTIVRGRIIGKEKTIEENPVFVYKILIPYGSVIDRHFGNSIRYITLKCDRIFNSIEEAEKSANVQCERSYILEKEKIKRYFNQFKK